MKISIFLPIYILINIFIVINNLYAGKSVAVLHINGSEIILDGVPNEPVWYGIDPATDFVQKDPYEGQKSVSDTKVRFAYDDTYFYAAIEIHFQTNETLTSTISRRDNLYNSERLIISLDTYFDHSTAYSFAVTSKGVRGEYVHSNDQEYDRDYDFNPVWEAIAVENDSGWTAELRIPFSQLRYNESEDMVWGLNMNHWCPSRKEDSYWVLVPKNEAGWSSKMGLLTGIKLPSKNLNVELLPYASSGVQLNPKDLTGSLFYKQNIYNFNAGLDLKMGLNSNLTLDATVNPDFGQVEADPAEVNLTAFETIFEEKRPFFAEGKSLFTRAARTYVYSRRIGSAPKLSLDADYSDIPNKTGILGAAKLTGRTNSGFNIGVVSALTDREYGKFYKNINQSTIETIVEPYTFYTAARIEKELDDNSSVIGFNLTGVERSLENDTLVSHFRNSAFTGGMDFRIRLFDNSYEVAGDIGGSYINGSRSVIIAAQAASARYYQRPDIDYVSVDSSAESLTGYASSLSFQKISGEHWLWYAKLQTISPGFELNDLGILQHADEIDSYGELKWRETTPGDFYHSYNLILFTENDWNYGWYKTKEWLGMESNITFVDQNSLYTAITKIFDAYSNTLTRGGPMMKYPGGWELNANFSTDFSRSYALNVNLYKYWDRTDQFTINISPGFNLKIGGFLDCNLTVGYNHFIYNRQYLASIADGNTSTFGVSYLFGRIERQTLYSRIRINYAYSPDITLELYIEPFYSKGRYSRFGELSAPGSMDLLIYGTEGTTITKDEANGIYNVDKGGSKFSISSPDFDYYSLRSNLVFRWEWMNGSTFYAVWQINRSFADITSTPIINGFFDTFSKSGIDILALKVSWWLNQNI